MELGLAGKRVFVTGASKGIGATTARIFAQEGANVAVGYYRDAAGAQEVVADITAPGRRGLAVQLDVADVRQATAAAAEVRARLPDYAARSLPLGRFAQPEEIARAIVFLASPAAGFITGETLNVNGGRDMA